MSRTRKWVIIVVSVIFAVGVGIAGFLWFTLFSTYVPSNIVDFKPTEFEATADHAFFFSIGNELKYSSEISSRAPTLLRGEIMEFLVSPDRKNIAAVVNGVLVVAAANGSAVRQVAAVDSIYREPKPIGRSFVRDEDFQWSKDSRFLYLIKDEYYESEGSQLFSPKGELWRYEIGTGRLELVVKPFSAYTYFLVGKSGVVFSVPTEAGDLRLRYFDDEAVSDLGDVDAWEVAKKDLGSGGAPFFSFSATHFHELYARGAAVKFEQFGRPEKLVIGGKSYLSFTQGEGMKGPFYCIDTENSVFLPGGRYFLLTAYCGNYEGQVLIDSKTGKYEKLPKDTRVYLALTTDDIPDYRISCGGIMAN